MPKVLLTVQYLAMLAIGVEPVLILGCVEATVLTPTVPEVALAENVSVTGV